MHRASPLQNDIGQRFYGIPEIQHNWPRAWNSNRYHHTTDMMAVTATDSQTVMQAVKCFINGLLSDACISY